MTACEGANRKRDASFSPSICAFEHNLIICQRVGVCIEKNTIPATKLHLNAGDTQNLVFPREWVAHELVGRGGFCRSRVWNMRSALYHGHRSTAAESLRWRTIQTRSPSRGKRALFSFGDSSLSQFSRPQIPSSQML